jgi:Nitrile hydratase, alpha chain
VDDAAWWLGREKGEGIVSEATGGSGGREEMKRRLIERSLEDDSFRQRLLVDPKAIVEQELGARLPEEVRVVAVEETSDTVYLVLPPSQAEGQSGGLSDSELESVAGGQPAEMTTETTCAAQCGTLDC